MISIYDYKQFSKYLFAVLKQKKVENSKYSYRYICRICQLQSPSILTDLIKGRRIATHDMLQRLNAFLCLNDNELSYATYMIELDRTKSTGAKSKLLKSMKDLVPPPEQIVIAANAKEALSKWYNLAITQLLNLPDASADPKWVSSRLGGKITPKQAKASLDKLKKLGVLKNTESGLKSVHSQFEVFSEGVPAAAGRQFHAEMMDLASEAIHTQAISDRYFGSNTFTINKSDIAKVQNELYKFRLHIQNKYAACGKGDEVYHFAMQFFKLSDET